MTGDDGGNEKEIVPTIKEIWGAAKTLRLGLMSHGFANMAFTMQD